MIPKTEMNKPRTTDLDTFCPLSFDNSDVKMGPVFASNVALATEVLLTPTKNKAKCIPRKNPANSILFLLFNEISLWGLFIL